ncbi:MAG: DUF4153 domain-containing protein [Weeksellaceae bacterium]|nr:DUF4153 domain-containing protein [Weeksellaceae bacterium]
MKQKLKEIWGKADDIFVRYPMILTMALIAALSAVVAIEMDNAVNQFSVIKLIFTACLGISVMFAVKMLSQRIGKRMLLELGALAFLTGFYFILPEKEKDFTEMYAFILIPTYILSHLLVSFIPFFGQNRELKFWQYNKNLFINIFLTAVFTGVLVGGVMLAILAVDKLFEFNFEETLYPKTFSFLAIFGSCFIFLLFGDRGLQQLEKDGNYPQILKFFTQYVLIPLLLIYVLILYFYSFKILINWELPRGWVSYLILAYSVVGILALLLVHPLREEGAKSWVKMFSKAFYYTLAPLIILLFTAIFTRILEYGYTEPRYFVLLVALWLTTVVLYFIFVRNGSIRFIPVSLFVFGMFSLVFPYFNALSVSKRSQKNELEKVLSRHKLTDNGKIDFTKRVSAKTVDEVADKFNFLQQRGEDEYLDLFLSVTQINELNQQKQNQLYRNVRGKVAGFFKNVDQNRHNRQRTEIYTPKLVYRTEGYQYVSKLNHFSENMNQGGPTINGDKIVLINRLQQNRPVFEISLNGKETVNLLPFVEKKLAAYASQTDRIPVDEISTEVNFEKYKVKIIFENLVRETSGKTRYYFNDGFMLIKER